MSNEPEEYNTRLFRWLQAQGRSEDTSDSSKNASAHVGIPLKRGALGARQ